VIYGLGLIERLEDPAHAAHVDSTAPSLAASANARDQPQRYGKIK
jgi:hypothetical protein